MDETPSQPAGWFPAPGDPTSERYWDGASWTERFRPLAPAAPAAPGAPQAPANATDTEAVPIYKKRWFQVVVAVGLISIIFIPTDDDAPSASSAGSEAQAPAAPAAPETPADAPAPAPAPAPEPEPEPVSTIAAEQLAFLEIIGTFKAQYDAASTDLQRANVRVQRRQALCEFLPSRTFSGWTGTVKSIGGNSDGDAYIDVEIAPGINIATWNNRLSDLGDNTLIKSNNPMYDLLLQLEKGQQVRFSGSFLSSSDECLRTSNLTEAFDMSRPDFKVRFTSVELG